jgi:hypothetical protein
VSFAAGAPSFGARHRAIKHYRFRIVLDVSVVPPVSPLPQLESAKRLSQLPSKVLLIWLISFIEGS